MPIAPAARVADPVVHPLPPVLTPGPGSPDVWIGMKPAWRGVPAAAAAAIQTAKAASDAVLTAAKAATVAAAGTPGAPAAIAAEEAAKTAAAAAMGSLITSCACGADIHACATPLPLPPHGPGVVIDGSPTVLFNNLPAARQGNKIIEALGPPNTIAMGMPTVLIGDGGGGGGGIGGGLLGALMGAAVGAAIGLIVGGPAGMIVGAIAGGIAGTQGGEKDRPHFQQEQPMSCGMAASRMVIATQTGNNVPESDLQTQSQNYPGAYDPVNGTNMGNLTPLLRANGVDNASEPQSGQTVGDLATATANGDPAIAHFNNPGHFVVVDGVRTNPDGSRTLQVRNPGDTEASEVSEADFNNRFSGWTITTN